MDLSPQPAQPPMSGAMSTGSAWLNILLTLVQSKHLFATLILQSKISGYAMDESAYPAAQPTTMKMLSSNIERRTAGREYVINMPTIFHNTCDLKFWRPKIFRLKMCRGP